MKCQKCQFENREAAKFCKKCGSRLELVCPSCGYPYQPDSAFCDECGYNFQAPQKSLDYSEPQSYTPKFLADKILTDRSAIEGERKLVTVLFADVAGYTSLSEKLDPEEVHQIMDGCFKILMDEIHKYEGTINQFTGDGVMALFGAPVAHEDHAQRACQAALSIQSALKAYHHKIMDAYGVEFRMRIGLNSGPVIVGAIGDDLRMDYTAVGDTTNLAARLQNAAEPGTVLASRDTYKIAGDFFEFTPLGQIAVKGKEAPQEAFMLAGRSDVKTRIDASVAKGLTKFVGRKTSMDALMGAYQQDTAGSGQVVGVVGEAGVGKSRLVWEFKNQLPAEEFTFLEGQCIHYGSAMAYLPILDILKSYFDIADDDKEFIIRNKIKDRVLGLDENLKSAITPFHELFSLQVDDPVYLQVAASVRKMRIFEALTGLFVRQSQTQPLIIVIDDLQWIDKISEEFLSYFMEWIYNTRVMLILLYRPEYTHQWGNKSHYTRVGLTQLSIESSTRLVEAILDDGEIGSEIKELILKRAGGNPLFVEELTHNLLENGSIEKKGHQYVLTRTASDIQVPETLQGIVASRIDRVEESLKRVMQMASVIGREFAFRVLASVMGMREELKSSLLNLQGLDFISEKQLFPELEYIFKHALTQEVAYNSLLQKRRKEIHEKVAASIEALYPDRLEEYYELLAYHYRRSDNQQKALFYLKLANEKANTLRAPQEAMGYFDAAMDLLDQMGDTPENQHQRISLIADQVYVFGPLFRIADYHDLLNRYEPMAVGLSDNELLARFYGSLASCKIMFGHCDQAIAIGVKAIELSRTAGSPESSAHACFPVLLGYRMTGDYEKVHELKKFYQSLWEEEFNLRLYVWTLNQVGWAYNDVGRVDNALEVGQAALLMAEKHSDHYLISLSHSMVAFSYNIKGCMADALKHAELAIEASNRSRAIVDEVLAKMIHAWILCCIGELQKGTEILSEYFSILQDTGILQFFLPCCTFLGEGYWSAGDYKRAHEVLEKGATLAERYNMKCMLIRTTYFLGEIALNTDVQRAPFYFEKTIAISQKINAEYYLARACAGFGRYYKQTGDTKQAREYLNKALDIFERLEIIDQPATVKEELAGLPL